MIVLEGADNSGKSTLAKAFGSQIVHPGDPPKSLSEALQMCDTQHYCAGLPLVHDRVTSISTQVYRNDPNWNPILNACAKRLLDRAAVRLVYCRPPIEKILDFSTHQNTDFDSPEYLERLSKMLPGVIERYDALMRQFNLSYRVFTFDYTTMEVESFVIAVTRSYSGRER